MSEQEQQKQKSTKKQQEQEDKAVQKPTQQAGMSTDPEAMKDKGYIERIDEKTSKH